MPSPLGWGRTRARWAAQKTRQDSSSLGSAARRLGQKDASETHSEQTRGAWRVPRGSGLVHTTRSGTSTRLGRVLAHHVAEWRPTSTAMPRSNQSNSEGAGATVEELRSRLRHQPVQCQAIHLPHAEGEQLLEGALAGLQAGGRRGHGPLGVLPKCFDDRV